MNENRITYAYSGSTVYARSGSTVNAPDSATRVGRDACVIRSMTQ